MYKGHCSAKLIQKFTTSKNKQPEIPISKKLGNWEFCSEHRKESRTRKIWVISVFDHNQEVNIHRLRVNTPSTQNFRLISDKDKRDLPDRHSILSQCSLLFWKKIYYQSPSSLPLHQTSMKQIVQLCFILFTFILLLFRANHHGHGSPLNLWGTLDVCDVLDRCV